MIDAGRLNPGRSAPVSAFDAAPPPDTTTSACFTLAAVGDATSAAPPTCFTMTGGFGSDDVEADVFDVVL